MKRPDISGYKWPAGSIISSESHICIEIMESRKTKPATINLRKQHNAIRSKLQHPAVFSSYPMRDRSADVVALYAGDRLVRYGIKADLSIGM